MNTPATSITASFRAVMCGKLVRLAAIEIEGDPDCMARWNEDSEYQQLQSSGPAALWTPAQIKGWIEKNTQDSYEFGIRKLDDDRLIGSVGLGGIDWVSGNAWVGIGIGEREYWGRGYGTEAMNLILGFAFAALNLKRVSLDVFEYNLRAYQSYCKCGFKDEGRLRQWMQRGGERFDMVFMGILRDEWEARQKIQRDLQVEQT